MQLSPATAEAYVRHAFAQMLEVADRLGEPLINQRPLGPHTNAVPDASVVIHVLEELYQHLGHMELTADALRA